MADTFRAHDLLWLSDRAELSTAEPPPPWLDAVLRPHRPLVVRRAPRLESGLVPVGIRGAGREQRCAAWVPATQIVRVVHPEHIATQAGWRHHPRLPEIPTLQALDGLKRLLDGTGFAWGITGSIGFELASGVVAMRDSSDLDLIIRMPCALSAPAAQALLEQLQTPRCRVDVQLETPHGAVALAEWARGSRQVLLKSAHGPWLVADPWAPPEPRSAA